MNKNKNKNPPKKNKNKMWVVGLKANEIGRKLKTGNGFNLGYD